MSFRSIDTDMSNTVLTDTAPFSPQGTVPTLQIRKMRFKDVRCIAEESSC